MVARLSAAQVKLYRHSTSPDALYKFGPRIGVTVNLPESVVTIRGSDSQIEIEALIDTGASDTSISPRVAQSLQLKPTDRVRAIGANGEYSSNVYSINFTFTGSGIDLRDWPVMEFDAREQTFDMLIGRDVLAHTLLVYDGATGHVGMEVPSAHHPLNQAPWTGSPIMRGQPSSPPDFRAVVQQKRHKQKQQKVARRKNRKPKKK